MPGLLGPALSLLASRWTGRVRTFPRRSRLWFRMLRHPVATRELQAVELSMSVSPEELLAVLDVSISRGDVRSFRHPGENRDDPELREAGHHSIEVLQRARFVRAGLDPEFEISGLSMRA